MPDEFRALFRREAEAQLTRIGENALGLESGGDPELLQQLFRDAHSIKGSSAMVGFDAVTRVAHALEDVLDQLRSGRRSPEPALVDIVLKTVDGLRELVAVLMRDEDGGAMAAALERPLRALGAQVEPELLAPVEPQDPVAPGDGEAAPAAFAPGDGDAGAAPRLARPRPATEEAIAVPVERLDELVRLVNESSAALLRVGRFIEQRTGEEDAQSVGEFRELARVLGALQQRTMRARMVSVGTIAAPLRRAVRDGARQTRKRARWEIVGEQTQLDRHVLETLRDPLMHLVRNSVDHGLEPPELRVARGKPPEGLVRLSANQVGSDVELVVADDGGGIDLDALRAAVGRPGLSDEDALNLIFTAGVSTAAEVTGLSGRGVGLDVVKSALAAVRGRIEVRTALGMGTEFVIRVPMTLAALHSLLVSAGEGSFAIPLQSVVTVLHPDDPDAATVSLGDQSIPLGSLAETLGFARNGDGAGPVVVLEGDGTLHAFRVERLMGQRAVVVKELGDVVPHLELVAGASIEPDGSVMLVLDAPALVERAHAATGKPRVRRPATLGGRRRVLVVDDAAAIRELERTILEKAGYDVVTAADGREALLRIADRTPDLVLTDIEMPELDGLGLIDAIRSTPRIASLPVIVVTTLSDSSERLHDLEFSADAFFPKADFDEGRLLKMVERLLAAG